MPQAKSFIFLFLLTVFTVNSFPQRAEEIGETVRLRLSENDYKTAISDLVKMRKEFPKPFHSNNYDYLLARLSEIDGDFANAMANYQSVVKRHSVLKEYALWHLSEIMRNSGNLFAERLFLKELSTISDQSLLKDAAAKRLARSNFESGNFSGAIESLERGSSHDSENPLNVAEDKTKSREDLVLLGHAYLKTKNLEKAREVFMELIDNAPNPDQPDDFALEGAKGLDRLEIGDDNFAKSAPKISDDEHFRRAEIYQFNRRFELARIHYEAIVNNFPGAKNAPISMYQIARGYAQEREDANAIEWFERLLNRFPNDDLAAFALYNAASSYANLDQTSAAVSRYEIYINENPKAANLERAHLNIIDAYRDAGDDQNALKWTAKTQAQFQTQMGEAVALFSQVRIRLSNEDWQNALNDLNRLKEMKNLGGTRIAGGTNKEEVEFLRGFVFEKLGRFGEAIEVYLSIPDGRSEYYGWRATERLKTLADTAKTSGLIEQKFKRLLTISQQTLTSSNADEIRIAAQNAFRLSSKEADRKSLLERIKRAYALLANYSSTPTGNLEKFGRRFVQNGKTFTAENRHQTLADEFLFLGLFDEATPELETALRENLQKNTGSLSDFLPDTAYTLAVFYKRGDIANRAIGYIEPGWRKVPKDFQIELIPRDQLEMLYPIPYSASLVKYGMEKSVDPRFVLSIMRQESRFRADVKSVAAARGLMQFISNTSNKMAKEMKIENFAQDDLYDPPTAIRFGSHYIANIFKDFPEMPAAVAASYNGGEDRMLRWFKRAKSDDPDRFVAEVIFSQTKDYAYKVMANYRVYKMLYDAGLKRVSENK